MIDVVPRGVCTHHRVEDGEELAHARGQRDFLRFAGGKEATIERAEHRVAARADKGRHEQRRAHGRATHGPTPRPWTHGRPAEFLGQALPDKYACVVWHVLASEIHRSAAASDCTSGSTRRRRPSSPRTRIAWLAPVRDSSPRSGRQHRRKRVTAQSSRAGPSRSFRDSFRRSALRPPEAAWSSWRTQAGSCGLVRSEC